MKKGTEKDKYSARSLRLLSLRLKTRGKEGPIKGGGERSRLSAVKKPVRCGERRARNNGEKNFREWNR